MRIRSLLGIVLLALPFAAVPAAATCEVVTVSSFPDINYTTICLLDQGEFGDGTQTFDHDYVAHVSHAVEVDPVFDYAFVNVDQGTWTYDDGDVQHRREWTTIGANTFWGVRGLVGTGVHARLDQRDQTAPEDGWGACSGIVGESSCIGAGGWFTAQGITSVGVGVYYQQSGSGESCEERADVYADVLGTFVPVNGAPAPCTAEIPMLYDAAPFGGLPVLP